MEHWRRQAEELLEEGKRMGEAVGAAKEAVRAMNMQHEAQWNASKERLNPWDDGGRGAHCFLKILTRVLY